MEFCEGLFDWTGVRTVGREIPHRGACFFDRGLNTGAFVRAEIVHDDDVAGSEIGLGVEPVLSSRQDVGSILLCRVSGFFST